ncbi:solute carrier family 49 member 4-like [Centruroides vittatus]|uniref:solute carrier family 49 member 4-like n=1 Tax=Centruroides vittatus TaxID=120091 RepID=UPI00350EF2D7
MKLYKRRWWILFVFSALNLLQSFVGITWITIQQSAKDVFSWEDWILIILTHCKTIAFVILGIPACWFLKRTGIRNNVLLANTFLFTGIGIRCVMQNIQIAKLLIYISQILVGTAGVVITGSSSLVSSIWFPVKQRTTVTTIFNLCNYVGIYLGFLIGPIVIDLSTLSPCRDANLNRMNISCVYLSGGRSEIAIHYQIDRIKYMMYFEFILASFVIFFVYMFFQKKPALSPSFTASLERLGLKTSFQILKKFV